MTFPVSPANGATATVNGITYTYDSSKNTWKRYPLDINDIQANLGTATTNITALFSNAATQATSINTINANVGTLYLGNTSTNANLGAYQTYANSVIYSNSNVTSYLTSNVSGLVSNTASIQLPKGTTAERPANPQYGAARFNTDIDGLEVYTSAGWKGLAAPPTISTVTPGTFSGVSGTEFIINGEAFSSDAQVYFVTSNSTALLAATTSFYSAVQLRATTPRAITVAEEPISVRVVQQSGTTTKIDCIDAGGVPAWVTSAGTLGSIFGANVVTVSLSATDPDGNAIVYSIASGSLPGGLSLTSGNGLINGTASPVLANTTYNFTIRASDTVNNTDRAFNYTILNRPPVINTAPGSLGTVYSGNAVPTATIDAYDPDGGTITFDVASGSLPANTALGSANGVIQGSTIVVTSNATYTFSIRATDQGSGVASTTYTYTVLNRPPQWNTAATMSNVNAETFTPITINAYDPDGGSVTYSLTSGSVPSGLTFVTANATIVGTAPEVETNTTSTFTVTATDVGSDSAARTFSLTVTPITDPFFANTVMSLKTAGNTVVADASSSNYSLTVVGDTRGSNFSPYNTSWSTLFTKSNTDYIGLPNASTAVGSNDFSIEAWIYPYDRNGALTIYGGNTDRATAGGSSLTFCLTNSNGYIEATAWMGGSGINLYSPAIPLSTWTHAVWCRTGGTMSLFVNGSRVATRSDVGANAVNAGSSSNNPAIGANGTGSADNFNGHISNFRMIIGSGVYDATASTITVPTGPLTAVTNTRVLACQDNRFIDRSTNSYQLTIGGSPKVSGFGPFAETDTSTGSMYFDGTGDYLNLGTPYNFGTNNFTVEGWFYLNSISGTQAFWGASNGGGGQSKLQPYIAAGNFGMDFNGSSIIHVSAATYLQAGAWNHIAFCRGGTGTNQFTAFVNGVRVALGTMGSQTSITDNFKIASSEYGVIGASYISNFRIVDGTDVYGYTNSTITVPTSPLTAIANTKLLTLQNRQPHNNHGFQDDSSKKSLITRSGNATQGTFTPFSQTGWSNYFDGATSSGFRTLANSNLSIASGGDVTVEFYMNTSVNSNNGLFGATDEAAWGATSWSFIYSSSAISLYNGNNGGSLWTIATPTLHDNQWHHVAIVRSSGTWQVFTDGVSRGTTTTQGTRTLGNASWRFAVGCIEPSLTDLKYTGYISNFRLTKSAVYTSGFTPPTTALTAIANTSLLTCQSNRILDNSSQGLAFTTVSTTSPSVQAFSPFAPTAAYSASTNGGSMYLDGTGDYLTIGSGTDFNLGTSDFSMEYWYYLTAYGSYAPGVFCKRTGGVATGWTMLTSGFVCLVGGTWYDSWSTPYWVGSTASTGFNNGTSTTKIGQWTHVLVTRQGTNARWFVNGQLIGYQSRTGAIDHLTGVPLAVGFGGATSEQPFTGYISSGRISIGSVPTDYQTASTTTGTQIFTPPTSPVTLTSQGASSNSVTTLLNFTKSAIIDYTGKNVFETAGDTKVSTTQSKWGTTSLYCPTTNGNYIVSPPNQPNLLFGTGNFTVEAWVYPTAFTNSATGLIGYGLSGGYVDWNLEINTSGTVLYIDNDAGRFSSSSNLSTNAWTHVAVVRTNTAVTLYFNGTSVGSYSTINNISGSSTSARLYIGTGAQVPGSRQFIGYIDNPRITKGYARYTANFTPPTRSFPNA